jgi:hypothetical protein
MIDIDSGEPIFLDSETVGLSGPAILIQWAQGKGPIHLHEVWREPAFETLKLIQDFACNTGGIVGFNLAFDWFQFSKLYTMFDLLPDLRIIPEDHIEELAVLEEKARNGPCVKPVKAMDLMLHARKGPYQSLMRRDDIRIRRVPAALAWELAAELDKRVSLKDIYFARKKNKYAPRWGVYDTKDPDFKNVVMKFAPSSALKTLAADALGIKSEAILRFSDIEVDKTWMPNESGYAPFARSIGEPGNWKGAWPDVITHHIDHWAYSEIARRYATNDVDITRGLYNFFGSPELGDNDSELACMVGSVRWKGFKIDIEAIKELKKKAQLLEKSAPKAPNAVKKYLAEVMNSIEQLVILESTKKTILQEISKWPDHPAASRAQQVLDARTAKKEIENYDKLLVAGRFHASFVVIGTKSSRMSGVDKLNAQGIKRTKDVRSCFPLADSGNILSGGDFVSFEVVLAEADYNDPDLRKVLLSGKKLHGIFGTFLYPPHTYEQILASSGTASDMYTPAKSGVFAIIYGGDHNTLHNRLGIPIEIAEEAFKRFASTYLGVGRARRKIIDSFCSMTQPGGIGTKVIWKEPAEFIQSMFGFRRYYTIENEICKALFKLAEDPPKEWRELKMKVVRRDRTQTVSGACQSSLFGAAFQIQAGAMRSAANHVIQSSGATITKHVQRKIWDIQPFGISPWLVQPMNVHDELMVPTHPDYVDKVAQVVSDSVESFRERVPLIEIEWHKEMKNWASK